MNRGTHAPRLVQSIQSYPRARRARPDRGGGGRSFAKQKLRGARPPRNLVPRIQRPPAQPPHAVRTAVRAVAPSRVRRLRFTNEQLVHLRANPARTVAAGFAEFAGVAGA